MITMRPKDVPAHEWPAMKARARQAAKSQPWLDPREFAPDCDNARPPRGGTWADESTASPAIRLLAEELMERYLLPQFIRCPLDASFALEVNGGHKGDAAKLLGVSRSTFYRMRRDAKV